MECDFGIRNHWAVTTLHRALYSSTVAACGILVSDSEL